MKKEAYSSSLDSSSASAFFAGFFFFLFFLFLDPVDLAKGRSRILRISSSSIFLSDLYWDRSSGAAAASLVRPFLVIATGFALVSG